MSKGGCPGSRSHSYHPVPGRARVPHGVAPVVQHGAPPLDFDLMDGMREKLAKALKDAQVLRGEVEELVGVYGTPETVEKHLKDAATSLGAAHTHLEEEVRKQAGRKRPLP